MVKIVNQIGGMEIYAFSEEMVPFSYSKVVQVFAQKSTKWQGFICSLACLIIS